MWWAVGLCVLCALHYTNGQDFRLPGDVIPSHYDLKLLYDIDPATNFSFFGVVDILLAATKPTTKIVLHAKNFTILQDEVKLITVGNHISGETENRVVRVTRVDMDANEFLTLTLSEELKTNEVYSLSIPFYGNLNMNLHGAYIDAYIDKKTMTKEYSIMTVFEPMTARTAFPCFDEPMFKATFKVSIGHHKDYHAIANMPLHSSTKVNANTFGQQASRPWDVIKYKNDFVWDNFGITVNMSTYHVSFVVSKFVHVEIPSNLSKTKLKVWARRDVIDQAAYAVSVTPKILSYFENWFNIPYGLPKMDQVAAHSFNVAGFEGWGLITYREYYLLYDEKETSLAQKMDMTMIISHEVSHQWFGNLVTMKWWTEVWLKEGFANFMADLAMTAVWPEIKDNGVIYEVIKVFEADSLRSSHPVTIPMEATSPTRIYEIYDEISYSKGHLLIRMLYKTLGEKVFKEAIHNYLAKNSYKSTVQEDLWEHLSEACIKHKTLPQNVTVARVVAPWTAQAGYPVINVIRTYNGNTVAIFQERYITEDNPLRAREFSESWWVPLSVLSQRDQQGPTPIMWLGNDQGISRKPHRYQHAAGDDEWLLFNVDLIALCRVNYDARNWMLLTNTLTSSSYTTIPVLSRVQLLSDAFELAWTNSLIYETAFKLASYLHQEQDHRPLNIGLRSLSFIENMLKRSPEYGYFQTYVRKLIEKKYKQFGGLSKKTTLKGNDYNSVMMQKITSDWACRMDVPECEQNAIELFQQWMDVKNPDTNNPIPVELRRTVYCVGVARGGARHWNFMLERTQNAASAESAVLAMNALAWTREAWLLHLTLEMAFTDISKSLLKEYFEQVIQEVIRSPMGFYIAKDFIYKKSDIVFARFKDEPMRFIRTLLEQFTSERELEEFWVWREKHTKFLVSSTYNIEQGIEKALINIGWIDRNRQYVVNKLKEFAENIPERRMSLKASSKATKIVFANFLICFVFFV